MNKTLATERPIERAKRMVEKAAQAKTPIAVLEKQKNGILECYNGFLGVEQLNRADLVVKIREIDNQIISQRITQEFPNAQIWNPEPLSWRDKNGMPVLAPFSPRNPECRLTQSGLSGHDAHDRTSVMPYYEDMRRKLYNHSAKIRRVGLWLSAPAAGFFLSSWWLSSATHKMLDVSPTIAATLFFWAITLIWAGALYSVWLRHPLLHYQATAHFKGLIPDKAREIILKAKGSELFKHVFIVTEIPQWKIAVEPKPVHSFDGDPLIIACDRQGRHWLIDSFDVTTVEAMATGYIETD